MDYQAVGAGVAAIVAAVGAVIAGVYTGRNGRAKDEDEARIKLTQSRIERESAVEAATKIRIEDLVRDAQDARKRLREVEDEFDDRETDLRRKGQRGWDLASYHFGLVAFLSHLLNNIFTSVSIDGTPEQVFKAVQNAMARMKTVTIPVSLEAPLEDRNDNRK